jgi:23S rRNA G2069 N7-methylase RlmK/C1962 C5-methylase RlmI
MQPLDFVRTLALAAADAGREVTLLALGEQAPDHPTPAAFQEGRYLKAAFIRVG